MNYARIRFRRNYSGNIKTNDNKEFSLENHPKINALENKLKF
jgi:hypothetical protein